MRDKVIDFVKTKIESLTWEEPIWEFCSGWDASVRKLFEGKDYHTLDLYQWGDVEVVTDVKNIPLEDNSVGLALLLEALEHIDEPKKAIDEIFRVLKPNGLFIVTTHTCWEIHGTDQYKDYWRFMPDGLSYLLASFRDVEIILDGPTNQPWGGGIWATAYKPQVKTSKNKKIIVGEENK